MRWRRVFDVLAGMVVLGLIAVGLGQVVPREPEPKRTGRSTQQEAAIALAWVRSSVREQAAVCDEREEFARRLVEREPETFDRVTVLRFVGVLCQGVA